RGRSGRRGHRHNQGQHWAVGMVGGRQFSSVPRSGPCRRGAVDCSGGDDRPAERSVYRPAFQTSGHTQGDENTEEGSRPGHGPPGVGAIRRLDGLRLDGASHTGKDAMDVTDPVESLDSVEFDPFSDDFFNAPFNTYRRLRDEAPVYHNEQYGFWALS